MSESYPWEAKRRSVPTEPVFSAPEPVAEPEPEATVEPEPEPEVDDEAEEPAPTPIRWPKK